MKKNKKKTFVRITAVVLALLMVVPMIISAFATVAYGAEITYVDEDGTRYTLTDFRDTQGHWAQETIRSWAGYNIVKGYNGNFMPNDYIKRCDIACIIDRVFGLTYTSYNSFRDLQDGQYYTDSLLKCYAAGFIQGDGKALRPMDTATREEVATILYRVFNMNEIEGKSRAKFTDSSSISSWASEEVGLMASRGYIKGYPDGSFGPQNPITRAELMTLIDNIVAVYITSEVRMGDTITNQWNGNIVNNKRGVTFLRSSVSDNMYCTQSCTGVELRESEIEGTLYCFSDRMNIKLVNSPVSTVYTDAVAEIIGAENIDTLIVSYEGSGTAIDEMPATLILEAGASIIIGRATYVNDSNKSKTYSSEEIYADIAKDGYLLGNSPSISVSKISITADNIVSFEDLRPTQMGDGELKSFGILSMEGTNIPTLDDYDDKISYRASYLDEYYRENGGTRGSICDEIGTQETGETYTYVPYAINYGGMMSYGEPIIIKAYDFDYYMTVLDTGKYPDEVQVVLTFEGSNIPLISDVTCYYDTTAAYITNRRERNMNLLRITDVDTRYETDSVKERVLYSTIISKYSESYNSPEVIPTYFGYKIRFAEGSVYSEFPALMNATPDKLSPISDIETGKSKTVGDTVIIQDNYIKTLSTIVNQYGVVYCYTKEGETPSTNMFDNSWYFMSEGTSIPFESEQRYSVNLKREENTDIHYAAYVRTVEGYYFGEVKKYQLSDAGDAPFVTDVSVLKMPDNYLMAAVSINSSILDVINSRVVDFYDTKNSVISGYSNTSFSDYLVCYNTDLTLSRAFLSLPYLKDLSSFKVQCYGYSFGDAVICDVTDVIDFTPYLLFSNESDGIYNYNVVLPDITQDNISDIVYSFDISGLSDGIVFDKQNMILSSSVDLKAISSDLIFTVTLSTGGSTVKTQSYIIDAEVR